MARGSSKDDGKDHVPNQANLELCPLPLRETGADALKQKPKTLNGTKRDVRVAFEEEEKRGKGKRQVVEDASIQMTAADVQPCQQLGTARGLGIAG